jgi:hypothetical protein
MNELSLDVDPGKLPPRSRTVYELIWLPILEGKKPGEIARELEVPPSWVSDRLKELYTDILLALGMFQPLKGDEYESLRDHIAEHGVVQPVLVDENGDTIKGRTRRKIANELGIDYPTIVLPGLNADEKRQLSIALTLGRRHLSRAEKRAAIVGELMANANRSDRKIAAICGVDKNTVNAARRQLEDEERRYLNPEAELESGETHHPASSSDKILGRAECPCCSNELMVVRRGGQLMLEQPFDHGA